MNGGGRRMRLKEFINFSELSVAALDGWKEGGGKVAGVYCVYAPTELIRAAGVVPVSLCGKKQAPIPAAERELPVGFCPLVKSSYGYAVTDTCPFFQASDFLVAETTCDGKKKMYELMGELKPLHLMHIPHTQAGAAPLRYWMDALAALERFLTARSGVAVDREVLREEIALHNRIREVLYEVCALGADPRSPLTARDLLAVQESKSFVVSQAGYLEALSALRDDLGAYLAQPGLAERDAVRVLLTGCPVGKGSDKVLTIAAELGADVVCMENCTGLKGLTLAVDETGDPYEALARRYLQIPCSCMSPNPGRAEALGELATLYRADAVLDLTWTGCHTYDAEATLMRRFVEDELALPYLHLATDYSESDSEQLRTRIEAFLELCE